LVSFVPSLSPFFFQPFALRCCSVYIGLGGLITGGRLTVSHH
jgi:hypothetical protein